MDKLLSLLSNLNLICVCAFFLFSLFFLYNFYLLTYLFFIFIFMDHCIWSACVVVTICSIQLFAWQKRNQVSIHKFKSLCWTWNQFRYVFPEAFSSTCSLPRPAVFALSSVQTEGEVIIPVSKLLVVSHCG